MADTLQTVFHMHFLTVAMYFDWKCTYMYSNLSNLVRIGSNNSMAMNRLWDIAWTIDDPFHWRIDASQDLNDLTLWFFHSDVDVDARDNVLNSPLHVAVLNGSHRSLMILIDHGAQLDALNKKDRTVLHLAALGNRPRTLKVRGLTWWRHKMETFSALLALCAGNSPVTGEFPSQRSVTRSFNVFFDLRLSKRMVKHSMTPVIWYVIALFMTSL